jgi:ATP-grasp domain-containing protein
MLPSDLTSFRDLFTGRRILWQLFFGAYCVGLDQLLPIRWVNCLDEGSDFDLISDQCDIRFRTVERPHQRRHNWIGSGIDVAFESSRDEIESILRRHPKHEWQITSSPACEPLETFCRENGYRYVGASARIASYFAPKRRLQEALHATGLPQTEGRWLQPGTRTLSEFQSEFGARFVLQAALGAAGSGTFLVRNDDDLQAAAARLGDVSVYVAPYLGGVSLNINAAVVGGLALTGYPNVQLSGVDQLATPWGGYCGNDYAAAGRLDKAVILEVQSQTDRIGKWLASHGFEGLYGLDFVISEYDGRAYAVDLNPRWQGSTSLSIQLELADGRLPLAAAEFAYRSGLIDRDTVESHREEFGQPLEGAQMCLRAPGTAAHVVEKPVRAGVYRSGAGTSFSESTVRFPGEVRDDEWLMVGGVPREGTVVDPGSWLVRISTKEAVAGRTSSELTPRASIIAASAYREFGIDG